MSLAGLLVHDVTIVTPGSTVGRYGDAVKDWATATETATKGWVARRSQDEVNGHREAQVSEWVLYVTADVALSGADRVVWGAYTFEVDGPPVRAWTPRGEHHVEVPLRYVSG